MLAHDCATTVPDRRQIGHMTITREHVTLLQFCLDNLCLFDNTSKLFSQVMLVMHHLECLTEPGRITKFVFRVLSFRVMDWFGVLL